MTFLSPSQRTHCWNITWALLSLNNFSRQLQKYGYAICRRSEAARVSEHAVPKDFSSHGRLETVTCADCVGLRRSRGSSWITYRRSWSRRRAAGCPCVPEADTPPCRRCRRRRPPLPPPPQPLPLRRTCRNRSQDETGRFSAEIRHDTQTAAVKMSLSNDYLL